MNLVLEPINNLVYLIIFLFLNLGLSVGLTYENFDFGVSYAFSIQDLTTTYRYPPRIFDLYLSFDFSPFLEIEGDNIKTTS